MAPGKTLQAPSYILNVRSRNKADYDKKVSNTEKQITDHDHNNKYIAT